MENMNNQLIGFLCLIVGLIAGWLLKGLCISVINRKRKPSSLKEIIEDVMKTWKKAFTELNGTPIDAEYRDGKIHINKVSTRDK